MSVPANIITEILNLQAQIAAASPIAAAQYATLKAIQLNVRQTETDVTGALTMAAGLLDTWVAPRDQPGIISQLNTEIESAHDQWRLFDMLTAVSRAHLNIDLVIGEVQPPLGVQ
jgi:hypothetical protein